MTGPQLPRDFPDRAIRDGLIHQDHLRAVLRRVAPEVADRLDYGRLEVVPRSFLLDDWRQREADVLVLLPLLGAPGAEVLVCILVEHQSSADPVMPLRLLLYAVLYWEQEWRAWEKKHAYAEPLRLTPVLPVVFRTGAEPWHTSRTLADLLAGPAELRGWAPLWPPRFYDLPEHSPTELLQSAEVWWQAMAVVRAEWAGPEEFAAVFAEGLGRLENWAKRDRVGWQQLVRLLLYWGLFRRPAGEHAAILATARQSVTNVDLLREVETMASQMYQNYEQELLARGEQRGLQRGEQIGEQRGKVQYARAVLRKLLQMHFGELPERVVQRIEAADLAWLDAVLDRVDSLTSPEELLS
jgi:hypothetical protein